MTKNSRSDKVMKMLDYFWESYVLPATETLVEAFVEFAGKVIEIFLWVTIPLWVIPYYIRRCKKQKEEREFKKQIW